MKTMKVHLGIMKPLCAFFMWRGAARTTGRYYATDCAVASAQSARSTAPPSSAALRPSG